MKTRLIHIPKTIDGMPSHSLKYTQDFSRKPKKGFLFLVPVFLTPTFSIKLSSLRETEKEVPVLP